MCNVTNNRDLSVTYTYFFCYYYREHTKSRANQQKTHECFVFSAFLLIGSKLVKLLLY